MAKPASLYPKPEPMIVNPKFMYFGCVAVAILFFMVGWTFKNIGVFP